MAIMAAVMVILSLVSEIGAHGGAVSHSKEKGMHINGDTQEICYSWVF